MLVAALQIIIYAAGMIYLDYNASTPVAPPVREAMLPYLDRFYGNPSSSHSMGRRVNEAVRKARSQVASMIGADPDQIVFTSGGTESNNMVIEGVARARRNRGGHIITSAIEHPAVEAPCEFLKSEGYEISHVGVDSTGRVDPRAVADALRDDTILISIMHANNEVGTIQPVPEIARIARQHGVLMHTDAAQSCGKISAFVEELGVDFLSIAGHKLYAPQGIGALYIRGGCELEPLLHGAGHERGRRSGTEPVPALVGLGAAAELAKQQPDRSRIEALRDRLQRGLQERLGGEVAVLGHPTQRLPNTLAIGFTGRIGSDILAACPDLCASTGAACHAGDRRKSATLTAMDVPDDVAFGAIRLSLGRFTTESQIDESVAMLISAV